MYLVGLTGGVGTGKSTVSQIFQSFGVPVIDADLIARQVVEPDTIVWQKLRESPFFGEEFFQKDGELDREAVAAKVFSDEKSRKEIERITHPEIRKEIIRKILYYAVRGRPFVILDVPLLFENSPLLQFCHKVVVVRCSDKNQVERLRRRTNWSEIEIRQRINSQMPLQEKVKRANYVVDNDNTVAETQRQVLKLYRTLRASKFHWIVRGVFATGVLILFSFFFVLAKFLRWIL